MGSFGQSTLEVSSAEKPIDPLIDLATITVA